MHCVYVKKKDFENPKAKTYLAEKFRGQKPWPYGITCRSTGRHMYGGELMEFYLPSDHGYQELHVGDIIVTTEGKEPKVYTTEKFHEKFILKKMDK